MTEHPILFSGPMVRAILDGRKTQTRRVVKPQPPVDAETCGPNSYSGEGGPAWWWCKSTDSNPVVWPKPGGKVITCPYGKPGHLLWVRETWRIGDGMNPECDPSKPTYFADWGNDKSIPVTWKPSIHMPKWASRIWLEVTDVRVERLQDISGRDAATEGFWLPPYDPQYPDGTFGMTENSMIDSFALTWRKLNDARPGCGWDANPFVWVIFFKRIEKPMERAA